MTSQERINARRARVQQLIKEGRVMNESMRKQQKKEIERQNKLEELAERVLAGLVSPSKVKSPVQVSTTVKTTAPEANMMIKSKVKFDRLSVTAESILKELQYS